MTEKPQLHGEAPVTTTEEPARSMLEDLLDSRGVQPATTATCLIGECIDDRHPTLRGRVQVRLGEREAQEHVLTDHAVSLRLPGDGLDTLAEDDADADTGADGSQAVADGANGAGDFREKRHVVSFAFLAGGRSAGLGSLGYSVVGVPSVLG